MVNIGEQPCVDSADRTAVVALVTRLAGLRIMARTKFATDQRCRNKALRC